MGEVLQKIHNLDHTHINLKPEDKPNFFSDRHQQVVDLDSEPIVSPERK